MSTNDILTVEGWSASGDQKSMYREFELGDFKKALTFAQNVGTIAEEMQHHPDIFIHNYKLVTITTSTHSAGTITEKDILLAQKINQIYY